jgi:hypothetical protein
MDITGWDSVVFTFTSPREVFARMVESVLARWPAALVDGFDEPPTCPELVARVPSERLPTECGHLMFYRDAVMARHMDEAAYVPMADGDGPFAVITRVRRGVEFKVSGLDELRAADHRVRPPNPYPAWLCTPELVEVTAVTPGDPATHTFSSWVLAEIRRACCGSAEPGAALGRARDNGSGEGKKGSG